MLQAVGQATRRDDAFDTHRWDNAKRGRYQRAVFPTVPARPFLIIPLFVRAWNALEARP